MTSSSSTIQYYGKAVGQVDQVGDGLYTGSGTAADGSTVYFGMERLDTDEHRTQWSQFSYACGERLINGRGYLRWLIQYIQNGLLWTPKIQEDIRKRDWWQLGEKEFATLCLLLKGRGFCDKGKVGDRKRQLLLHGTSQGTCGFMPEAIDYVAYASKSPITGRVSFPLECPETFRDLDRSYRPVVMAVGVFLHKGRLYQNRGIFRNPLSRIQGDTPGISVCLHAFTAKVVTSFLDPSKEYFGVRAVPQMAKILARTVGEQNVLSELEAYKQGISIPKVQVGSDTPLAVAIKTLTDWGEQRRPVLPPKKRVKTVSERLFKQIDPALIAVFVVAFLALFALCSQGSDGE